MTNTYKLLKSIKVQVVISRIMMPLVFLSIVFMSSSDIRAQSVTGQVLSDEDNEPLIGASVVEKGTDNGTTTDFEGNFSLDISTFPTVLEVGYIGYGVKEMKLSQAQSGLEIRLREGELLDEVVVTALGIERKSKNLTYSVQQIDGGKLDEVRDANFANTLNGKVAGVVVNQGAGGPGSSTRIILRGNTSISGNNNALVVVDGVPVDNSSRDQASDDFGGFNSGDGISNLNPDDFESVSILKGAAAAALYGSRAANGVILITTKSGTEGKVSVKVNSGVTVENPLLLPELQNTYTQGAGGTSNNTANGSWGAAGTTYEDNVKDFFQTGVSTNTNVSLAGGNENTQAYFSYTNSYVRGIVPGNQLQKNNFNFRMKHKITSKLTFDGKVTYFLQGIDDKPKVGEENGTVMNIYKIPRSVSLTEAQDFENEDGSPKYWTSSAIYMNPYWMINRTNNFDDRDRVTMLGSLKYDLSDDISLMVRAAQDKSNDNAGFQFYNGTNILGSQGGDYILGNGYVVEENYDILLTGDHDISEKFRVNYSLGSALNKQEQSYTVSTANGLLVPNQFQLQFARALASETSILRREQQSIYGTASFAYNDYLILDLTARNDWSSNLPAPHSFFYPSVGLTFVASDAMNLPSAITFAKVRGSWTQVGNDASPFLLQQEFVLSQGGDGGLISQSATKAIPDLKPEETTSFEIGLDLRFLSNKIGLDFTYYKSNSVNQLVLSELPSGTGFSQEYINTGDIQNSGVEITLNAKVIEKTDFSYSTTLNYAANKNEIIELADGVDRLFLSSSFARTADPIIEKGGSYGDLYAEGWLQDDNGRYIVNDEGKPVGSGARSKKVGNFNPDFTLGWSNSLNYKNFSLSLLIDGRFGGVMTSGTEANLAFDGNAAYTEAFRDGGLVLDAVTEDGSPNTVAISAEDLWSTVSTGRYSWGEFFTYDATNIRIRELSLGYTFELNEKSPFEYIKASLVSRNLGFLYRGKAILDIQGIPERKMNFDPEINLGSGNFQGVEYGNLPSTRSIGLNLKFGF